MSGALLLLSQVLSIRERKEILSGAGLGHLLQERDGQRQSWEEAAVCRTLVKSGSQGQNKGR